jgi:hypothetical protein
LADGFLQVIGQEGRQVQTPAKPVFYPYFSIYYKDTTKAGLAESRIGMESALAPMNIFLPEVAGVRMIF